LETNVYQVHSSSNFTERQTGAHGSDNGRTCLFYISSIRYTWGLSFFRIVKIVWAGLRWTWI